MIFKKITLLGVMAVLCPKKLKAQRPRLKAYLLIAFWLCLSVLQVKAQDKVAVNKQSGVASLKAGDKLPESFWQQEYSILKQGKLTKQKLANYKGKLLILDFWNSSCIPCIEAFPKLDSLQQNHEARLQIIPITKQSLSNVGAFIRSSAYTNKTALGIIVGDTYFSKLFPHLALPHLAWISPEGKYINATSGEYLNTGNIHAVLNGKDVKLKSKSDQLNFNVKTALFNVLSNTSVTVNFYTVIGGHLSGLATRAGVIVDSTNRVKRYYGINHSILQLYAIALNTNLPLLANRRQLKVADASQFTYQSKDGYLAEWMAKNTYTYEKQMPMATDQDGFNNALLQDLNDSFKLEATIEQQLVAGFEIEILAQPTQSNYQKLALNLNETGDKPYLRKITMNDLVRILTMQPNMPTVWNQTNYNGTFDVELPRVPKNKEEWQQFLGIMGLGLKPVSKTQATFVLTDKTN